MKPANALLLDCPHASADTKQAVVLFLQAFCRRHRVHYLWRKGWGIPRPAVFSSGIAGQS
ncbi:MAG: hypothetical protein ABF416_06195 [Zymomonas mobilis subsp. pomaceae]